ncbi:MAG: PAS domain S-box protein [Candidatus Hodarchaeota archaeon]
MEVHAVVKEKELDSYIHALPELIDEGVVILNENGIIIHVNSRLCNILGVSRKEILNKNFVKFITDDEKPRFLNEFKLLREGKRGKNEFTWIHGKRGKLFLNSKTLPYFDNNGKFKGGAAIITDITLEKIAEKEFQRRNELEDIIAWISADFINMKPESIGNGINLLLSDLGKFFNMDRSYIFLFKEGGKTIEKAYEWWGEGIKPWGESKENYPIEIFEKFLEDINENRAFQVASREEIPGDAVSEKQAFEMHHIQSTINVPITYQGRTRGFLGFISLRESVAWSEEVTLTLKRVGIIVANALERKNVREKLERKSRFESMIVEFASNAIKLKLEVIDDGINWILKELGIFLGFDRTAVFILGDDGKGVDRVCLYNADNAELNKDSLESALKGNFPFINQQLKSPDLLFYPSLDDIPPEGVNFRKQCEKLDIKQVFMIPLLDGTKLLGVLSGTSLTKNVSFSIDDIPLVKLVGEILTNILQRRNYLEKLRKSEKRYQALFEMNPYGVMLIDNEGKVTELNEWMEALTMYSKEELIGKHFLDLPVLTREARDKIVESYETLLSTGLKHPIEVQIERKSGTKIWLSIAGNFVNLGDEQILQVTAWDVTDRKNAEQQLVESEERYRLISENAGEIIVLLNQGGNPLYINTKAIELNLGYTAQETNKTILIDYFHPDEIQDIDQRSKRLYEGPSVRMKGENRLRNSEGKYIWFEIEASSFLDEDGELRVLLVARNIHEKKMANEKVRELLETENIRLKEIDEIRKNFVMNATHELKTPLVSIFSATEFLNNNFDGMKPNEAKSVVNMIFRGAKRLRSLIFDIVDFSKIEANKLELKMEKKHIKEIVEDTMDGLSYLMDQQKHTIFTEIPNDLEIIIDPLRIEQVISNLIINAVKNSPHGGESKLKVEYTGDQVKFSLKDNGVGITEDEMGQLFKKFGKVDRKGVDININIQGSGLGLFISKSIVEAHGGKIWVESEGRNKGSTFCFTIPLNL